MSEIYFELASILEKLEFEFSRFYCSRQRHRSKLVLLDSYTFKELLSVYTLGSMAHSLTTLIAIGLIEIRRFSHHQHFSPVQLFLREQNAMQYCVLSVM